MSLTLQIIGSALVLAAIGAGSQQWYRRMFWCNLASAAVWSVVAWQSLLWGLLGLQVGIALLAARGLWRLREQEHKRQYEIMQNPQAW